MLILWIKDWIKFTFEASKLRQSFEKYLRYTDYYYYSIPGSVVKTRIREKPSKTLKLLRPTHFGHWLCPKLCTVGVCTLLLPNMSLVRPGVRYGVGHACQRYIYFSHCRGSPTTILVQRLGIFLIFSFHRKNNNYAGEEFLCSGLKAPAKACRVWRVFQLFRKKTLSTGRKMKKQGFPRSDFDYSSIQIRPILGSRHRQ